MTIIKYANILSDAIVQSGWTYQQIIQKCEQNGTKFSKSYLSKISAGFLPPPSDEINKALATVLNPVSSVNYKKLALAKYKEIIPTEILEAIASGQ